MIHFHELSYQVHVQKVQHPKSEALEASQPHVRHFSAPRPPHQSTPPPDSLFSLVEAFKAELARLRRDFIGGPTPLYHAKRLTDFIGGAQTLDGKRVKEGAEPGKVGLKIREDSGRNYM